LEKYFEEVIKAYQRIFNRCGIEPIITKASGGTIGGSTTYEFQAPTKVGEDIVYLNKETGKAFNKELLDEIPEKERDQYEQVPAVEAGQVFSLGTKYSKAMGANFVDREGKEKPIVMGCYGIGLGRLMAIMVEAFHDDRGINWPEEVAPFAIHLISLGNTDEVNKAAEKVYETLTKKGAEVLFDDREEEGAPEKETPEAPLRAIGRPLKKKVVLRTLKKTEVTVPKAIKRIIRIAEVIAVAELAKRMGVKGGDLIKKLMELGVFVNINQMIDADVASLVASEFGYEVEKTSLEHQEMLERKEDLPEQLRPRPPVGGCRSTGGATPCRSAGPSGSCRATSIPCSSACSSRWSSPSPGSRCCGSSGWASAPG